MRVRLGLVPLTLALIVVGCEQPPNKEIAAAETAVAQARTDGAEQYAADRFKEADKALQEARSRVQAREYRAALSSATEAAEKARQASQAVDAAKKLAQSAIQVAQVEIEAALDDAGAVREAAIKARVPEKVFEELAARLSAMRQELSGVADLTAKGDLLAAQKTVTEMRARASALADAFRTAQASWDAAHPKGRPRPRR
jgi:hypothetical protein